MNSHTHSVDSAMNFALKSEEDLRSKLQKMKARLATAVKKEDAEAVESLSAEVAALETGHARAQLRVDNFFTTQ